MEPTNFKSGVNSVCAMCFKTEAKYTCPRCNARYCSAGCYRGEKHQRCSEAFYRDCVMESLKGAGGAKADKERMVEFLKQIQDELRDPEDDDDDLHERLAGLDLDTDSQGIWSRLNPKEKREFETMLQDGQLGSVVESWKPWWLENVPLVEDISETTRSRPFRYPDVVDSVPGIASLLRNKVPSECVQYAVLNVLYAYAYTARLYNGDYNDMPLESAGCVLSISRALKQGVFSSSEEAMNDCVISLQDKSHPHFVSAQFCIAIVEDVVKLLSGKDNIYAMAALSELWRLFRNAKREAGALSKRASNSSASEASAYVAPKCGSQLGRRTDEELDTESPRREKQAFYGVQKKVEFFLAWCKVYGDILTKHVPSIQLEYCRLSTELATHAEYTANLEKQWGGSVPRPKPNKLVQEL